MHDVPPPDTALRAVVRRAFARAPGRAARTVLAGALVLAGTATAPAARAATSDVLVVLGADGRSHVVQHTLSSDGPIVRLGLADDVAPQAIRFSGPERATFAEARRRSPTWVSLWSGSASVRYRHRYGDALERDASDTFRLRVPSVPERLSIEDGEPVRSSLTWALPDELEIVSFGGGEGRGRWFMSDGMLTFEQPDIVPVTLDVAWRRRRADRPPPDPPDPPAPHGEGAPIAGPGADTEGDTDGDGVPDHRDVCLDAERPARVDGLGCRLPAGDGRAGLVLEGIEFPAGKSYLDAAARAVLDRVARALLDESDESDGSDGSDEDGNGRGDSTYEIAAHTDGAGSRARNLRLSAQRAEAVRHYLMLRGVGPNRLRARGYGEARPLADDATEAGRRTNRRIELARADER